MNNQINIIGLYANGYWSKEREQHVFNSVATKDNYIYSIGKDLTFFEVVDFLFEEAQKRNSYIFQIYDLSYLFSQIIKNLYDNQKQDLLNSVMKEDSPRTVKIGSNSKVYTIKYVKNKKISFVNELGIKIEIIDFSSLFGTTIYNVFRSVLNIEENEDMKEYYRNMNPTVTEDSISKFIFTQAKYNKETSLNIEKVCSIMIPNLSKILNVELKFLGSSGFVASKWISNKGLPTGQDISETLSNEAYLFANEFYFGGIFETMQYGLFNSTVYEYDINSAYVDVMKDLPDLHNASSFFETDFEKIKRLYNNDNYIVFLRGVGLSQSAIFGAFNHRTTSDNIVRPLVSSAMITLKEYNALNKAGLIKEFTLNKALIVELKNNNKPLKELGEMYEERLRVGKNTPLGIAYKTVYNSIYGKLSQSVGAYKYSNPIYATLITAGCRNKIYKAIETYTGDWEKDLVAIATDAVFFRNKHDNLPISNKLGEWEELELSNYWQMKDGVYGYGEEFSDIKNNTGTEVMKTRSVKLHDMKKVLPEIIEMLKKCQDDKLWYKKTIKVPIEFRFFSLFDVNGIEKVGQCTKEDFKEVVFTGENKRDIECEIDINGNISHKTGEGGVFVTKVKMPSSRDELVLYLRKKVIGNANIKKKDENVLYELRKKVFDNYKVEETALEYEYTEEDLKNIKINEIYKSKVC